MEDIKQSLTVYWDAVLNDNPIILEGGAVYHMEPFTAGSRECGIYFSPYQNTMKYFWWNGDLYHHNNLEFMGIMPKSYLQSHPANAQILGRDRYFIINNLPTCPPNLVELNKILQEITDSSLNL